MQFDVFKIRTVISRNELSIKKLNKNFITQRDIDDINDDIVRKLIKRGSSYYTDKIDDITIQSRLLNTDYIEIALKKFYKNGILLIPNFLSKDIVDNLCREIEEVSASYISKLDNNKFIEDKDAIVQKGLIIKKNYHELANSIKPVINIRSGYDDGMVDIFNVDRLLSGSDSSETFNFIRKNKFLEEFLKNIDSNLSIKNMNSYVNTGVTKTRGFHVDSFGTQVKIFIYLTDVLSFDNGPYTYTRGTHLDTPYKVINKTLSNYLNSHTETPVLPFEDIYPVLASKGSLIISHQAGFHRGFPQHTKGSRRVLTINCY